MFVVALCSQNCSKCVKCSLQQVLNLVGFVLVAFEPPSIACITEMLQVHFAVVVVFVILLFFKTAGLVERHSAAACASGCYVSCARSGYRDRVCRAAPQRGACHE